MNSESPKPRHNNSVESVMISVASPKTILSWSKGEVENQETFKHDGLEPARGGLFCETIFGPRKNWQCSCGQYKGKKHRGVICQKCGVEVTTNLVRRKRMGHIELAVPVSHIWFFKSRPSYIGLALDLPESHLERVLYYNDYLVIDPGTTPLREHQLLSESDYREALETCGENTFVAKMGAEAVRDSLARVDLHKQIAHLQEAMTTSRNKQVRKKIAQRIKLLQAFIASGTRPEWMILTVLPVIPPDLRLLKHSKDGRVIISDLHELYRRVIKQNNRLRTLLQLKTSEARIQGEEKRDLQEAVDALLDNGRNGLTVTVPVTRTVRRPLSSLSVGLGGKKGRFRQDLLGKRVDFSGRSVIVVGPELKLHQCGLPKKMALTLFEPFVIRRLKEQGYVHTGINVNKLCKTEGERAWEVFKQVTKGHDWSSGSVTLESVVWDILDDVVKEQPVLLNRAPTLHRLSIQAFEPVLIEGEAIRLHPLVCGAYGADFDGDQVAVHVPLSADAQREARLLMMAPLNVLSPATGKPIVIPTQDITLGCYYVTAEPRQPQDTNKRLMLFGSKIEVLFAHSTGVLRTHDRVLLANPDFDQKTIYGDATKKVIETTVGRVIFSEICPEKLGFYNRPVKKNALSEMLWHCYKECGHKRTIVLLDQLKDLGFREATKAGISISIDDMIIPEEKNQKLADAQEKITNVEREYQKGNVSQPERHNKIVDIWTECTDQISSVLLHRLEQNRGKPEYNPIHLMVDSGARGNKEQVRQLAGLRGLMAKLSGNIIEKPILANFREGLSVLDYLISTHGARKGQSDRARGTARAGELTRKLIFAAQNVLVREHDCGTTRGIWVQAIHEGENVLVKLCERIVGRFSVDDVTDPFNPNQVVVHANAEIDENQAHELESIGTKRVKIRSVLTCESKLGVCMKCYGRDLARNKLVDVGEAVGIVAAQSIGEPGTQFTMRTFHHGGVASVSLKRPEIKAKHDGVIQYSEGLHVVQRADGSNVVLNRNGSISIRTEDGHELEKHTVAVGSFISIPSQGKIKKGEKLLDWDPYNISVLSEKAGKVKFSDIIEGATMKLEVDAATQLQTMSIIKHKSKLQPEIVILDHNGEPMARYPVASGARIVVKEGDKTVGGTLLAQISLGESKTEDITSGLPHVVELFEARHPKDPAEIAKIEGIVSFGVCSGGIRCVITNQQTGLPEDHFIPIGKHVIVHKGDYVKEGQQLTEGPVDPHQILAIFGSQQVQEYLVNEVQKVYRLQDVTINDKHIEIVVRQMPRKVRVTEPGETDFLWDDLVDKIEFDDKNERIRDKSGKPAEAQQVLMGITKASLETDSFLGAAAFQNTTRVLTEAAVMSKCDELVGLMENVMMGRLIPAGTGFEVHPKVPLKSLVQVEEEFNSGNLSSATSTTIAKQEVSSPSNENRMPDANPT